jgi:hypothetical protein
MEGSDMTSKSINARRNTRRAIAIAMTVGLLGIAAGSGSADAGRTATRAAIGARCPTHSFIQYRACAW